MLPAPLQALSAAWLANPWLLWGVGPMAAVAAGFFVSAFVLEGLIATGWFDSALIVYPSASGQPKSRAAGVAETQVRASGREEGEGGAGAARERKGPRSQRAPRSTLRRAPGRAFGQFKRPANLASPC